MNELQPIEAKVLTTKEIFEENKARMKAMRAELRESAKMFFKDGVNSLFEKFPDLESFSWTQYTPYWCDGDVCEFGVNWDDPNINGKKVQQWKYDPKQKKSVRLEGPTQDMAKAVVSLLKSFSENDLKTMFGDHVRIIAKKDKIVTKEFEHE